MILPQELLLPLAGQTCGEDIALAVTAGLTRKGLDISKVTSVATDGSPSKKGQYKSFVSLLKKDIDHNVISFAVLPIKRHPPVQNFPQEISKVMELVMLIINKIAESDFNHRQFCELLQEDDHQYSDLFPHINVRSVQG
jgi:hypothetical protein